MNTINRKNLNKGLRKRRSRAKFAGTSERPRLSVFRSNRYIYAQLIDDVAGRTVMSASSLKAGKSKAKNKSSASREVGTALGEAAVKAGIKQAVFHKGPYQYHGRVAEVAEGARAAGLKI